MDTLLFEIDEDEIIVQEDGSIIVIISLGGDEDLPPAA